MAIPSPQRDLPAGLLGGADAWDQPQASVILLDEFFDAAVVVHVLAGAATTQAASSSTGAVGQVHLLAGAASAVSAASGAGAVIQTHILSGPVAQLPIHIDGQPLEIDGLPVMITAPSVDTQVCLSSSGAVSQGTNSTELTGAATTQTITSQAGAIGQVHVLVGAGCSQAISSTAGAAVQTHVLMAAAVAIDSIASASAIVQTHLLAGAQSSQTATSSGGAISSVAAEVWPDEAAQAIVPAGGVRAVAPTFNPRAAVPAATSRAVAPETGDDMQPIRTFEQYRQDREIYQIDFAAKYLANTNDTAANLLAVGADPGITVTPQVAPGGALSSGVVNLAVDDPTAVGSYKVWAQISTTGGRQRTGVIVIQVEDL